MKKAFVTTVISLLVSTVLAAQAPATIPEKPEMVFVKGGTFNMGSNYGEIIEQPIHNVTINSFSIGKYEVTVGQYKAFCKATGYIMPNYPYLSNDSFPMAWVNYNDAVNYCNWLSKKFGGDWRLPTEAEWEYAARGGNKSKGYTYVGGNELEKVAWFSDNSERQPHIIGSKKPNELGIYDMSGNVWEWCNDWYAEDYYKTSSSFNPQGPEIGEKRVLRGGSWYDWSISCRVAYRSNNRTPSFTNPFNGFRVVLSR